MMMNETNALARALAKKFGFHPIEAERAWEVDATFDFLYEQWNFIGPPTVKKQTDEETAEKYFAAVERICDEMSAKLEKNKTKFLCGDRMTVCDFQMAHLRWTYFENHLVQTGDFYTVKSMEMIAKREVLKAYYERLFKELKPILDARKPSPF